MGRIKTWNNKKGGNKMKYITKQEKEAFDYLNALREGGKINMWGGSPYLKEEFNISSKEATVLLFKWMDVFNKNSYEHLFNKKEKK